MALIQRQIALAGPLTVADYMASALTHPRHGYYAKGDPIGAAGDFITAPEVSQMFGELIGAWAADAWEAMGRPAPFRLVEIGPGRGTLMADALRLVAGVPGLGEALEVHLVETGEALRARQAERLGDAVAAWHGELAAVPEGPAVIVANELFDALPVHQFVRTLKGWRERLVDRDPFTGGLRFVLARGPTPAAALLAGKEGAPPGAVTEVSPAAISLAHEIGRRIAAFGGRALIVDYGKDDGALGDTLQAVRAHRRHGVLEAPGEADLSARVDFAALARAIAEAGAAPFGPVGQGDFLIALGIEARAARLKARASPAQAGDIDAALERLTSPAAMGALFRVLAAAPRGTPPPPGLAP